MTIVNALLATVNVGIAAGAAVRVADLALSPRRRRKTVKRVKRKVRQKKRGKK